MSVVEFFTSNPLYIVEAVIVIAVGIYLVRNQFRKDGVTLPQSPIINQATSSFMPVGGLGKKKVIILQPRDKRAYEVPVTDEQEFSLECPKKDNYTRRYYKAGPGYTLPNGTTIFFALEGNAYTALFKNDQDVKVKLPEALRSIWGEKLYNDMPPELKDPIERYVYGVTIIPEKIPLEDKESSMSPVSLDDENDRKALEQLAKNLRNKGKMDWGTFLQGGAVVGFIVYLVINIGWIPVVGR